MRFIFRSTVDDVIKESRKGVRRDQHEPEPEPQEPPWLLRGVPTPRRSRPQYRLEQAVMQTIEQREALRLAQDRYIDVSLSVFQLLGVFGHNGHGRLESVLLA